MSEPNYYNGEKLLSKLDLNGKKPEIYVCDGTRTAGKTFFFKDFLLEKIVNENNKIGIITRFQKTADSIPGAFIKDLAEVKYPGWSTSTGKIGGGKVISFNLKAPPMVEGSEERETYVAGYVFPLTSVEFIKINSSFFIDVNWMLMDEFQLLDGRYGKDEVENLVTIHRSVARGAGKQSRYVPLIMVGNALDLYNPYYLKMGISQRMQPDTRFLRGDGWVMEHTVNTNAAQQIAESGVVRALGGEKLDYIMGERYLNSPALIVKSLPSVSMPYMHITDGNISILIWHSQNSQCRSILYVTELRDYVNPRFGIMATGMEGLSVPGASMIPVHTSRFIMGFVRNGGVRFVGGKAKKLFMDLLKTL